PRLVEDRARQALSGAPAAPRPAPAAARVLLGDILVPEAVLISPRRLTREEAFRELIGRLDAPDPGGALALILEREKAGSTLIGSGLAIPHARIPGLKSVRAALGVVHGGLLGAPEEEQPAQVVILFLSPLEDFRGHLAFLAAVSGLFRREGLTQELLAAADARAAVEAVRRAEGGA
ncbi:MAG: PTS sugar transporter subunit IIA, partial [Elusimicrobia bacterium]|nr:PTS sugar transporter subunit IIA [Elusimicrobiota bacterium]